jgi:hypothetical protein
MKIVEACDVSLQLNGFRLRENWITFSIASLIDPKPLKTLSEAHSARNRTGASDFRHGNIFWVSSCDTSEDFQVSWVSLSRVRLAKRKHFGDKITKMSRLSRIGERKHVLSRDK